MNSQGSRSIVAGFVALVAGARITSGDLAPGPDDEPDRDIVMMDDFIYGEPREP